MMTILHWQYVTGLQNACTDFIIFQIPACELRLDSYETKT